MKSYTRNTPFRFATVLLFSLLVMASVAGAQLPVPSSSQFDITGFIQSATLGGPGTGAGTGAHQGGVITVNGHVVTVPSETIVILPANALTWQELFAQAPAPYTGVATGMALADVPAPLTTYEARIVGNRVIGGPGGADVYIAGLIWISQQALNNGQGFINCINYATGEIRVGGAIGNCAAGTRIRLNDPAVGLTGTGRYGRAVTPDKRFMVDQDNPTVRSVSGFPMCIPRVLADPQIPGNPDDPLCPLTQRPISVAGNPPVFLTLYTMNNPVTLPGVPPDPTIQAPFEVGDYVTFAGTLVQDATPATPTAGPWPGIANTYISAHTIVNNVGIYTWAGTSPAYVAIDVSFIGTGGLTVIGANEAAIMTRFEGFSTDTSRVVHLYGIDLNPSTGAPSDRDWGTIGVDPGPTIGAATGRWRYRPPCGLTVPTPSNFKDCTPPPSNSYLPPTREVRAVVEGAWTPGGPQTTYANGIIAGQYHAPMADYRFPENLPGKPVVENNFNSIPFLAAGGYTSSAGTLVKVLDPWPSSTPPPPPPCTVAPVAVTGGPYTDSSGGSITLNGSAVTADTPVTFLWTAAAGTFSNPNIANPVYTAPTVGTLTNVGLTLTVTTCGGTGVSGTIVAVNGASAPTVNHVAPLTLFSGAAGNLAVTGSDPNVPAAVPLFFAATQAGVPALNNFTVTQGPNPPGTSATITFNAPVLPLGQVTTSVVNLTITATNTANLVSAPEFTSVTVTPLPDLITPTSAQYRVNNKRLIITANSSVVSPNVNLFLQSYVTTTGTTYNPDPAAGGAGNLFTNNGAGAYTITLNGVPEPACGNPAGNTTPCPTKSLDVKSNLNGDSGGFALTKIQ
ncbi:MAG: hypothetical protein LAO76_08090 [Acidobacteriia bacterium]|nr:hypothetical protein [Terriglobia bacterium]